MFGIGQIIKRKSLLETVICGLHYLTRMIVAKIEIGWLRLRGYDITYSVKLRGNSRFFQSYKNSIHIGEKCELGFGVKLYAGFQGKIKLKNNVSVYDGTVIDIHSRLEIGENTLIAPFCYIVDYDHVTRDKDIPIISQGFVSKPIIIGRNVWLGARVMVLKGVKIGDNSVIGAGAVVTHDIPANSVAAGIPAEVIKKK